MATEPASPSSRPTPPAAATEPDRGDAQRGDAAEADAQAEDEDALTTPTRERDRYLDLAKRTQADFDNYRKRAAKDAAAAGARAKAGLVRELLPVVDNLERALASATESDDGDRRGRPAGPRRAGRRARAQRHRRAASRPASGSTRPSTRPSRCGREEGAESGIVLDVVEKGYKLNDTVIRPARVVVSG